MMSSEFNSDDAEFIIIFLRYLIENICGLCYSRKIWNDAISQSSQQALSERVRTTFEEKKSHYVT